MNIGTPELIVIFVLALIFFGPQKLPEIGRSLGKTLRELKKASRDLSSVLHLDDDYEVEREVSNVKETIQDSVSGIEEDNELNRSGVDGSEKG